MNDRNAIRNAGTGVIAILLFFMMYPGVYEKVFTDFKSLDTFKIVLVSIPGILGLPLFGFLIYQLTVALWGWGLYRDEARRIIAEKRFEGYDKEDWNGCLRPTKKIRGMNRESLFWDPVFVIDYYQDCPKELIEWARRKRDSQLFSLNIITAIVVALLGGALINTLYSDSVFPSKRALVLVVILLLFLSRSYFHHKKLADYAELIWAERFLAGKRMLMKE